MLKWHHGLSFTVAALIVLTLCAAQAKTSLLTLSDGVIVYSGPATYYRPLAVLPSKTELRASNKITRAREGEFYRVVVKVGEKQKAIGFIPVTANVTLSPDQLDEEELEKFGEVALVSKAAQVTYSNLRDRHNAWSLGYMHYLSPGFYVKAFGGQYLTPDSKGWIGGGEIGNDALIFRNISGLVSYAAGVFKPTADGDVFEGSSGLNAMMQAAAGLRYNMGGVLSFSAAATQIVLFNANNSYVTSGLNLTLEIGL